jgi:hypothetical protein
MIKKMKQMGRFNKYSDGVGTGHIAAKKYLSGAAMVFRLW